MNLITKLQMAIDNFIKNSYKSMLFFILLTISMILLAGTIYISQRINVNIIQVEDKIKYPADRLGMIDFDPYENLEMTTDEYLEYTAEI